MSKKLTKYEELKHGLKVKCKIKGIQINDAKLSINKDGRVYICQNQIEGSPCAEEYLGYEYAWCTAFENEDSKDWSKAVTALKSVEEVEDLK